MRMEVIKDNILHPINNTLHLVELQVQKSILIIINLK